MTDPVEIIDTLGVREVVYTCPPLCGCVYWCEAFKTANDAGRERERKYRLALVELELREIEQATVSCGGTANEYECAMGELPYTAQALQANAECGMGSA